MECKCGCSVSSQHKDKTNAFEFLFRKCKACGRVGDEILYKHGKLVALGTEARDLYRSVEAFFEG